MVTTTLGIDRLLLIEKLIRIDNKQGIIVPFRFNKLQRHFHTHKSNRNIILKHRQGGCCLDPDTLVLTTDLRWVKLENIHIGDELIGVDEFPLDGKGQSRHFRRTKVLGKVGMEAVVYLIKTDKGNLIATGEHRFLCSTTGGKLNSRWRKIDERLDARKARLKVGSKIRFVVEPWDSPSYEDGWFGGLVDGEGSMPQDRAVLKISQCAGDVMDRCKRYLSDYKHTRYYTEYGGYNHTPVDAIEIYTIPNLMELIGKCRPSRFINRISWWEGKALNGKKIGVMYGEVLDITPLGKRRVIDIQTSTGTFLANGFISHNSSSILADEFIDCITIPHSSCAVVSHETRATQRLLDRVQFFYDMMEEPKPLIGAESRSEKTFPGLHSSIYIGTAGARAFGRGDTIRKALLSELAWYEDGEKILTGVEDAVPLTGELIIECFDDKTEILTDRGWLLFKDTELTDRVLSKNKDTNIAYWSPIYRIIEREANKLILVQGRGLNFAVTPNHNVWARRGRTIQSYKMIPAKELLEYSEWEFDSSVEWQGEEVGYFSLGDSQIPMDLWLKFLGFFLSEGWVSKNVVSIYQEGEYNQEFRETTIQIANCLGTELGFRKDIHTFAINSKELSSYLSNYTKPKSFPRELINLSKRQLKIFFDAYMKGDGEKRRNRCVTKDKELRDAIQEISFKLGHRSNYIVKPERTDNRGIHHCESYVISFYKSNRPSARHSRNQIRVIPYLGKVYCVSIPEDHLLLIRREGKLVWQGNCTPNGEDNIFYDRWVKAREGKSPYKPFFYQWWWTEDYSIPLGSEIALLEDRGELHYTSDEQELVDKYHLTEDQIRWRRWKIAEKGGLFWQEYPEDELSCFITIGDPVFDQYTLTSLANSAYEGDRHEKGWTFWIPPQEGMRYTIGADSSAGSPTGSYSAAVIIDDLWRICATFQARLEPHTFAGILKEMGKCYNNAQIAVERNFTGYAVLSHLQDYGNLYHQRDFLTGKVLSQVGWWTNGQTKELMMTKMKEKVGQVKIWDMNLIRQLRGYRYIKHLPTAQTYDDMAIALMIAIAVRSVEGTARGYRGAVTAWDW